MIKAENEYLEKEVYNCYKEDSFGLALTIIYVITKYIFVNKQNKVY